MLDDNVCYSYKELDNYISAKVHTKVNVEGRQISQTINCVAESNYLFILLKFSVFIAVINTWQWIIFGWKLLISLGFFLKLLQYET